MNKIKLYSTSKKQLADTVTPVHLYLQLRDHFDESMLLESTDFRSVENCNSYIGLGKLAGIEAQNGIVTIQLPGMEATKHSCTDRHQLSGYLQSFMDSFELIMDGSYKLTNGIFGHFNFESIQYFDSLSFDPDKRQVDIPDAKFILYRYILAIDHFKDEMYLLENHLDQHVKTIDKIESWIQNTAGIQSFKFVRHGSETSSLTDQDFRDLVTKGKYHCKIGDVFQVVFARRFKQSFTGDDFNVYRALRSVNPSPYLFYFDMGSYRIFGSSPESQLVIHNGIATVNPIAGTYKRTGNDELDQVKAKELALDPKENAEHIMLVDLARNDLGIHSDKVEVKILKEIQYFSHVIHLVSNVEGKLSKGFNMFKVFGDTFPAGTLSGAPKYKAIELIKTYEPEARNYYGGSIGFAGFDGSLVHAITIRSFLSKDNTLHYQAGAGIVASSVEESELQEVNNKLGALRTAMLRAESI
ncbi:MAG: anthranilate synthase component I family protein [Saprospiraceae bacterium]|nr:anthranilate synthase component I family protein [Saprospiraceae bacterium]